MDKKMFELAQENLKHAYVPYSHFPVSAVLKLKDGTLITGVNIENASYGLANCAERTALFKAYSEGVKKEDIEAILVTTTKDYLVSPCGACRQVMLELMPKDAVVYIVDAKAKYQTFLNHELLPAGFTEDDL